MISTGRTRTWRLRRMVAASTIAVFVAASCGGGSDGGSAEDTPDATSGPVEDTATTVAPNGEVATTVESTTLPTDAVVATIAPEEPADPVPGGTLRYGLEADVDGLNPTTSALSAPGLMMSNAVFDTLAANDTEGNAVPYLAESFTPSADFKDWTIKLRPGIKFHDGTDMNSDAVVKAFEAQRNDPLVGLAVRPFFPETGRDRPNRRPDGDGSPPRFEPVLPAEPHGTARLRAVARLGGCRPRRPDAQPASRWAPARSSTTAAARTR